MVMLLSLLHTQLTLASLPTPFIERAKLEVPLLKLFGTLPTSSISFNVKTLSFTATPGSITLHLRVPSAHFSMFPPNPGPPVFASPGQFDLAAARTV